MARPSRQTFIRCQCSFRRSITDNIQTVHFHIRIGLQLIDHPADFSQFLRVIHVFGTNIDFIHLEIQKTFRLNIPLFDFFRFPVADKQTEEPLRKASIHVPTSLCQIPRCSLMPFRRNHIRHAARPDAHPSSMIRTEPDIDTESYHFLVFRLFHYIWLLVASLLLGAHQRKLTLTPNIKGHDL